MRQRTKTKGRSSVSCPWRNPPSSPRHDWGWVEHCSLSAVFPRSDNRRGVRAKDVQVDIGAIASRLPSACSRASARPRRPGDPRRLRPERQRPQAGWPDGNPAHRALASACWPWLPVRPDENFTWRARAIARIISAGQCSAISVPVGFRSVTASCMRLRPRRSSRTRLSELGSKKVPVDPLESVGWPQIG